MGALMVSVEPATAKLGRTQGPCGSPGPLRHPVGRSPRWPPASAPVTVGCSVSVPPGCMADVGSPPRAVARGVLEHPGKGGGGHVVIAVPAAALS